MFVKQRINTNTCVKNRPVDKKYGMSLVITAHNTYSGKRINSTHPLETVRYLWNNGIQYMSTASDKLHNMVAPLSNNNI